jgi:hypothetical protein
MPRTPRHVVAIIEIVNSVSYRRSVAFEGADAHRVTRPRRPRPNASEAIWWCRLSWQTVESGVSRPSRCLDGQGSRVHKIQTAKSWRGVQGCLRSYRTQGDAKNLQSLQLVLPRGAHFIIDVERAGGPKLARLRRRFRRTSGMSARPSAARSLSIISKALSEAPSEQ